MVLHDIVRSIFFGTVVLAFWPSETIQDLCVVAIKRGGHDIHPLCASLNSPAFNNDVNEMVFMSQVMPQTLSKFVKLDGNARFLSPLCVHKADFRIFCTWRRKHRDAEASYASGSSRHTKCVYHSPRDADARTTTHASSRGLNRGKNIA